MKLPTFHDSIVAPVDAAEVVEVVVSLATAVLTILFIGVLMVINGHGPAFGFSPATPTLIIGSICLIAAVMVKALSPAKLDEAVKHAGDAR